MNEFQPPGSDDVRAAAQRIRGSVVRTPCLRSVTLSELTRAEIFVKFENLQFTASFKERGALNRLLLLSEAERARGVIAMSAGNHAQAVAVHASRLGIRSTIVMPRYTPNVKIEHTRRAGAEIVLHGEDLSEAAEHARRLAERRELVLVHPYDDPAVIAGQGTVALEMLEDQPELDALVCPVGGGGLIAGCALAARSERPGIEIYGVEPMRFPSMHQALRGEPAVWGRDSIAEGIAVKEPGVLTREIVRSLVREILLVEELDLEHAVLLYLEIEKTLAEGAGAASLAAVVKYSDRFAGRRVGIVLSGGNIDLLVLASIIERGLAREGRLARLRVRIPDRPGALADIAGVLARLGLQVVEVAHQRAFGQLALREAEVEFVISARGAEHLEELRNTLREAGYAYEFPDASTRRDGGD